jgi:CheY-like chemotaxis protein
MRILIVADEPMLLDFMEAVFLGRPHDVRAFVSAASALQAIRSWPPDVLVCDLDLAGAQGEGLARALAGIPRPQRVVLISDEPHRLARCRPAADAVLLKPLQGGELINAVERSR